MLANDWALNIKRFIFFHFHFYFSLFYCIIFIHFWMVPHKLRFDENSRTYVCERGWIISGLFLLSNRFGKFIFGAFNSFQSMTTFCTEISNTLAYDLVRLKRNCLFLPCRYSHQPFINHWALLDFSMQKSFRVRLQIIRRYCLIFATYTKSCSTFISHRRIRWFCFGVNFVMFNRGIKEHENKKVQKYIDLRIDDYVKTREWIEIKVVREIPIMLDHYYHHMRHAHCTRPQAYGSLSALIAHNVNLCDRAITLIYRFIKRHKTYPTIHWHSTVPN